MRDKIVENSGGKKSIKQRNKVQKEYNKTHAADTISATCVKILFQSDIIKRFSCARPDPSGSVHRGYGSFSVLQK